jgi:hypothetical protein
MLPGVYSGMGRGGTEAFSLTLGNTATAVTHNGTVTMPTGISAGDLIVVINSATNENTGSPPAYPTAAYGTGFTSISTLSGQWSYTPVDDTYYYRSRACLSYKIADGTESGASIGGFMNGSAEHAAVVVYNATVSIATVTVMDLEATTNLASHTVGASASSVDCVIVGATASSDAAGWTTYSPTYDVSIQATGTSWQYLDSKMATLYQAIGTTADVTIDPTNSTTSGATPVQYFFSAYLEVEP